MIAIFSKIFMFTEISIVVVDSAQFGLMRELNLEYAPIV